MHGKGGDVGLHARVADVDACMRARRLKPCFHTFRFNVAIKTLVSHFFDPPASIQRGN